MTLCLTEAQKSEEREELGILRGQCGYTLTIEWEVGRRRDRRRGDQG